mgnify:CR=1 FL=1
MKTTEDIKQLLKQKYENNDFRILKDGTKTIELQNIQFVADKDYILRKPNYEYAHRELNWYLSQSLNVNDIPGETPAIWKKCADIYGNINSNYGWMVFSKENGSQYKNCIKTLIEDPHSRQACMIYNRPSMHFDSVKYRRKDFCCTYSVQCFLNENSSNDGYTLKYIVYMRSNDVVFGFNNDLYWHKYVQNIMCEQLSEQLKCTVEPEDIIWHSGSLHVYERHFNLLK